MRVALLAALLLIVNVVSALAQAAQLPLGEQCFSALAPTSGGPGGTGTGYIGLLGTITAGSGGAAGTYSTALTGGSGSGAQANITVSGGGVTAVAVYNPGVGYVVGDTLSATAGNIGGTTGFSVPVSSVAINQALAGGSVGYYIPSTLTTKTTWKDSGEATQNTNPITLDANGCATVYGNGIYRQIVKDSLGNIVWDQLTGFQITALGGFNSPSSSTYTVMASDFGKIITSFNAGGTLTVTMPSTASINAGFTVGFFSENSNNLVLNRAGSQVFVYTGQLLTQTSFTLSNQNEIFVTFDGNNWIVTGGGLAANTSYSAGLWSNGSPSANISRLDRLLIGTAGVNTGDYNPTTISDWLNALVPSLTSWSQLASISPLSLIGVLGASRTSDNATYAALNASIGVVGFENNNASAGLGTALYGEAWNNTSGAFTAAEELDIVNKGSLTHIDPFNTTPSGTTAALSLASGGARAGAGPASVALLLQNNGTTYDKGIVVESGGLTSGSGTAIALPYGNQITWYSSAGTTAASLQGILGGGLNFNVGTALNTVVVLDDNAHLDVTGGAPSITSCGSSPSIVGSDIAGKFTTGSGASSCTINWHTAYATAPFCVFFGYSATPTVTAASINGTILSVSAGATYTYQCFGPQGG